MRWGTRAPHTATALLLLLVSQAGDASCQQQASDDAVRSRVCWVDTRGVQVSTDGRYVTDEITARCDVQVQEHTLEAWLEFSTSKWGGWRRPVGPARSSTIPDTEGVTLRVGLDCQEGYYRAAWRVHGRGPVVPDHPAGIDFDILDHDYGSTRIDATECER